MYLQKIYLLTMDTRFLESFVTVVDNGSIAEAARRLNLTSAAVAQRIRALESEIGARLLSRSGRTVRPTEAGAAILDHSRDFVQKIRDLKSIANNGTSGELRLGAVSTAISGLLPGILALLIEKYPQIEIYMLPGTSAELYQKVLDGDLDAAVIAQPPFAIPKACGWHVLRAEPLVVLTPASLSVRDPHATLSTQPFIRYDRNNWGGRLVDGYLRRAGIRPHDRFELDGLEAIAVLVDRGLGVSVVPDWAPPWPEGLSLRKTLLPANPFTRRMGLLWTRSSVRGRLINVFLEQAATALPLRTFAPPKRTISHKRRR
jgi:DNA-binding transcriptional LysR family regulator